MLTRRAALMSAAALAGCAALPRRRPARAPLVIAQGGAAGERPEHTLLAYSRAIELGADYIAADLVITGDGVLVCRSTNELSQTTDVGARPEFRARRTVKPIDGRPRVGWFSEDFTLAELRTLRAKEGLPRLRPENTAFDGQEAVPTLEEVLDLASRMGRERARPVGVYATLKHPSYFRGVGLPLEQALIAALEGAGLNIAGSPMVVGAFEVESLRTLRPLTPVALAQFIAAEGGPYDPELVGPSRPYLEMAKPDGLAEIAGYAQVLAPEKTLLLPRNLQGRSRAPTRLVGDAHAAGLIVHPWTFRAENQFLPFEHRRGSDPADRGDLTAELMEAIALSVDGLFTDNPAYALPVAASAAR